MLDFIRERISPQNKFLLLYHKIISFLAALIYGYPGKKLKVIGVTGTNGKTTTVNLIAKIFEEAGYKVGRATSINFSIGSEVWENATKQTTIARFAMQRLLSKMANAKCDVAVLEITSHAITQSRIYGIPIHTAVLTNVTGDHIEYHASFEAYRQAKMRLFGKNPKISILPVDEPNFPYFNELKADKKVTYGLQKGDVHSHEANFTDAGTEFILHIETKKKNEKTAVALSLPGEFNLRNALCACAAAFSWGIPIQTIKNALEKITHMPGRYEKIECRHGFLIIVDYAHTPDALEYLCKFYRKVTFGNLILVFGATGGGRDKSKRPKMGEIADRYCDIAIVTDDDPYTEDRSAIIEMVASGIKNKKEGEALFKIIGRREAIEKALALAKKGDTVLIAGKGCEPIQIIGKEKIPWDDRNIVREILTKQD